MASKNYKHLQGLEATASFSDCGQFRYLLTIQDPALNTGDKVCVIMQNPSVANETRADKSVQFLEKLLFQIKPAPFGRVGQLLIVNQFAFIQTRGFRGVEQKVGPENDRYLQQAVLEANLVLMAWGKSNPYTSRKWVINELLQSKNREVLYQTKAHPSRGRYSRFIAPYCPEDHLPGCVQWLPTSTKEQGVSTD